MGQSSEGRWVMGASACLWAEEMQRGDGWSQRDDDECSKVLVEAHEVKNLIGRVPLSQESEGDNVKDS